MVRGGMLIPLTASAKVGVQVVKQCPGRAQQMPSRCPDTSLDSRSWKNRRAPCSAALWPSFLLRFYVVASLQHSGNAKRASTAKLHHGRGHASTASAILTAVANIGRMEALSFRPRAPGTPRLASNRLSQGKSLFSRSGRRDRRGKWAPPHGKHATKDLSVL